MEQYKKAEYKYEYNICTIADNDIYKKQCKALEKFIPNLEFIEELNDVDGSKIAIYQRNGLQLSVHNSFYIDAVFIKSEFDIDPYFE